MWWRDRGRTVGYVKGLLREGGLENDGEWGNRKGRLKGERGRSGFYGVGEFRKEKEESVKES